MPRVFISYSRRDLAFVEKLAADLQAADLDVWWDLSSIQGGDEWQRKIQSALETSQFCLVVLSPDSVQSVWVEREYLYANELDLKVLPLFYRECKTPLAFKNIQYIDVRNNNYTRRLPEILKVLGVEPKNISSLPKEQVININAPPLHGGLLPRSIGEAVAQISLDGRIPTEEEIFSMSRSANVLPSGGQNRRTIGGIEFVRVPKGSFVMGSKDDNSLASDAEKPQHTVEISYDFWMARFILTNHQFAEFIKATGYVTIAEKEGGWHPKQSTFVKGVNWQHPTDAKDKWEDKQDHPVVQVSWYDAMQYCQWFNQTLKSELGDVLLRLPTEAEWEKAARGAYGNEWPWGNEFDKNKCNSAEGKKGGTTPVGLYSSVGGDSPYGCTDMVGNVWEWTHTLWNKYPYNAKDGREDEKSLGTRVLRGGSFYLIQDGARCACRSGGDFLGYRDFNLGFRFVVS